MAASVESWRVKIFSKKTKEKLDEVEEQPSCSSCRYVKSKTCGSQKKHLKCKKPPPIPSPSLSSLRDSLGGNCCTCCCTLVELFKEALKTMGGDPNSRVCELLCEISDLLLALANDCVLLIRKICCCLIGRVK